MDELYVKRCRGFPKRPGGRSGPTASGRSQLGLRGRPEQDRGAAVPVEDAYTGACEQRALVRAFARQRQDDDPSSARRAVPVRADLVSPPGALLAAIARRTGLPGAPTFPARPEVPLSTTALLVNGRGQRWYVPIAQLGEKSAARILKWLQMCQKELGVAIGQQALTKRSRVARR